MISKNVKKYLSLFVCVIMALTTLAGCAGKKSSNTQKDAEPTKITFMSILYGTQPPRTEGNPILNKMQEFTNTKLEISYIPSGSYKDKLNVAIASNQLPMVTIVDNGMMKSSSVMNGMKNGMFWEVGSLLKDYPNLNKFYSDPIVLNNCKVDGKLYGLPRPRVLGRVGLVVRQDWLDNLGLKVPTTPDEVYQVAKAFTFNDPDKNGKNDTYGLEYADISTGSYGWNGISQLTVALGGFNSWGV